MALKAEKGRAGARVAASHTGSLAGQHGAVQAAFARAGVVEAATSDEFFDSLQSLGAGRLVAGRSDAVLTISDGPGVLASDAAERLGLCLLPPGEATARCIRELAPEFAAAGNLIDLTPQCPPANCPAPIQSVFDDPAYQGVIVISCGLDIAEFGHGVAAHRRSEKPVTAFVREVPSIESQCTDADVVAVWDELAALGDGTVLVAEQVRGELELIAGGLRVVFIGLGGVEAEVLQDVLFLLAQTATGDLDRAIARLHSDPRVVEVDVKPIVVRDGCTLVVDALVVKAQ